MDRNGVPLPSKSAKRPAVQYSAGVDNSMSFRLTREPTVRDLIDLCDYYEEKLARFIVNEQMKIQAANQPHYTLTKKLIDSVRAQAEALDRQERLRAENTKRYIEILDQLSVLIDDPDPTTSGSDKEAKVADDCEGESAPGFRYKLTEEQISEYVTRTLAELEAQKKTLKNRTEMVQFLRKQKELLERGDRIDTINENVYW